MKLENKKIAFLGDSITVGVGVQTLEFLYWKQIAALNGAHCFAYGISGTRIAPQHPKTDADQYYGSRVEQMIPNADIVVVFGGTNDFGHGNAALGTISDRTEDTFCGAYYCLLKQLIERYPNAQIVAATPLHRETEDEVVCSEMGIHRCGPLSDYVQAIREVVEAFDIPVVDLFCDCPIQPCIPIIKEKYAPDGLHPNDAGHVLIAKCILDVLEQL